MKLAFKKFSTPKSRRNVFGMTIVETAVAITIFGALVTIALSMFVWVGRIYYKGLYDSRLQEVSSNVLDAVSESIQASGANIEDPIGCYSLDSPSVNNQPKNSLGSGCNRMAKGGSSGQELEEAWTGYCVGNVLYAYKPGYQLVDKALLDSLPSGSDDRLSDSVFISVQLGSGDGCGSPEDIGEILYDSDLPDKATELLKEHMRVVKFEIKPVGDVSTGLYDVRLRLAYGGQADDCEVDDNVFVTKSTSTITPNKNDLKDTAECKGGNSAPFYRDVEIIQCQGAESFCSVSDDEIKVLKRVL